jgi:hypothetical protein
VSFDSVPSQPRPRNLRPQQLGFTPRRPVGWLRPIELSRTALRVVLSEQFGAYLDKRELQSALPSTIHDEGSGAQEIWFDFVADLGDGFDATYTIAYLLAQPQLTVGGQELPRGRFLLMGGDEVYPTASMTAYEDRTKGPYEAAFPVFNQQDAPNLYALPGNHDWYDGLTAFLRLFVKNGTDSIGGWRTNQARSYFTLALPHRWWLVAIDTQFGAYLDDPQLHYFKAAAANFQPGDKVILCSPTPGWVEATTEEPSAYDTVDYFVRTVLAPTGVQIPLMLSGDLHHYAHYATPGRDLVHCGGGGAYLYPTHKMPRRIQVPPPASLSRKQSDSRTYRLQATYPTKARSRLYAGGVFARLPWRNKGFVGLLGLLNMLFMLALGETLNHPTGTTLHLFSIPVTGIGLVIMLGTIFFAMPPTAGARHPRHWLFGLVHGAAQIGLGIAGALAWRHLPFVNWQWPLPVVAAVLIYLPVAGLIATELACLYLLVASIARVNVNELFAGQGIDNAKSFLRLRLGPEGLTIYPIAVDRVNRRWVAQPQAPAPAAWLRPKRPIKTHLAEPPITIR